MGRKSGYSVYVGGKSGKSPNAGQLLATSVTEDNALKILENVVRLHRKDCDSSQTRPRVSHTIGKVGFDEFKTRVTSYK